MANEIIVLDGDGGLNVAVLFLYPIEIAPKRGEALVAPTPSTTLPANAAGLLTSQELNHLDGGALAFEVTSVEVTESKTQAELATAARELYARKLKDFTDRLTRRFKYAGRRIDA